MSDYTLLVTYSLLLLLVAIYAICKIGHTPFRLISSAWIAVFIASLSSAYAQTSPNTSSAIQTKENTSKKPSIISLSPAATELIYTLGVEAHLLAVDKNSNYPIATKNLPNMGDPFRPSAESMALLQADIVIPFTENPILQSLQKQLGFELLPMQPQNIPALLDFAQQLNLRLNAQKAPQIQQWKAQWQQLQQRFPAQNKTIFVFLGTNPLFTLGKNAFLTQSLHTCGVKSLFEEQPQASLMISVEALLSHTPDIIIAGIDTQQPRQAQIQRIKQDLHTIGLNIQESQIITEDQDILFRPSIRFLQALPELCQRIQATTPSDRY